MIKNEQRFDTNVVTTVVVRDFHFVTNSLEVVVDLPSRNRRRQLWQKKRQTNEVVRAQMPRNIHLLVVFTLFYHLLFMSLFYIMFCFKKFFLTRVVTLFCGDVACSEKMR